MKRATRCLHLIRSRTKFQPKWTIIIKHMKKKRTHFSLVCSGSLPKGSFRSFNPNQKRSFSITPSWRETTATYCGLGKLWSFENFVVKRSRDLSLSPWFIYYCFKTIMDRTLLNVSCLILIKKLARWVRVWAVLDRYSNTISLRPWEFSTMWDRGKHKHLTSSPPG